MSNYKGVNYRLARNDIPTAIIYTRVSTKEQVSNYSLESQEKICISYAEKNGWKVLRVFREEGESAKTADRTKLQEIIKYVAINKGKVGKLVVHDVTRFARNVEDHYTVRVILRRYGVELRSATQPFSNDASGELMETVLAGISQFDNRIRSDKTIIGMKARLLNGLWSTRASWGYVNDTEKKIIIPNSEKVPIIKMLFEKYVTGKYTYKELATIANKFGQKNMHKIKMSKQLVSKIISNPIYYGMIVVPKFGISLMGSHEPIISKELFMCAQDVRNGIIGRKQPRNKDNPNFPLRGIKCGECGKNITGGPATSKTKKIYHYYNCRSDKSECIKKASIKKDDLENDFTDFLKELTPNEDFFEILKEAIRITHKSELNSVSFSERKIKTKINELKDKKDKLLELRIEGSISNEDFVPKNEEYKLQIGELEQEMNSLFIPELEVDNVIESGVEFLKHLPDNWKSLDVKDLRVLRTLLFPENLSYHYPTIKTLKLSPVYNIKSEFYDEKTHKVTLRGIEPRLQP